MEHYGKPADLAYLMQQWSSAILRQNKFLQQINPLDGTFTFDTGDYSPAALILLDFTWRLAGVRQEGECLRNGTFVRRGTAFDPVTVFDSRQLESLK